MNTLRRRWREASDRRMAARTLAATRDRPYGRSAYCLGAGLTDDDVFANTYPYPPPAHPDPYRTPGLDAVVDEAYHGIDRGLGIVHPDSFNHHDPFDHHDPFGI